MMLTLPRTLSSMTKFLPVISLMNLASTGISTFWKFIVIAALRPAAGLRRAHQPGQGRSPLDLPRLTHLESPPPWYRRSRQRRIVAVDGRRIVRQRRPAPRPPMQCTDESCKCRRHQSFHSDPTPGNRNRVRVYGARDGGFNYPLIAKF